MTIPPAIAFALGIPIGMLILLLIAVLMESGRASDVEPTAPGGIPVDKE